MLIKQWPLVILTCIFSFTGCGNTTHSKKDENSSTESRSPKYPGVHELKSKNYEWDLNNSDPLCDLSAFRGSVRQSFDGSCQKTQLAANTTYLFEKLSLRTYFLKGPVDAIIDANNIEMHVEDLSEFQGTLKCPEGLTCNLYTKTPVSLFRLKLLGKFTVYSVPFASSASIETYCDNTVCSNYHEISYRFHKERHEKRESWLLTRDDALAPEICPICGKEKNMRFLFQDCKFQVREKTIRNDVLMEDEKIADSKVSIEKGTNYTHFIKAIRIFIGDKNDVDKLNID